MVLAAALTVALVTFRAGAANIAFGSILAPVDPFPSSEMATAIHGLEALGALDLLALVAAV